MIIAWQRQARPGAAPTATEALTTRRYTLPMAEWNLPGRGRRNNDLIPVEVFCVFCPDVSRHPNVVANALRYHARELALHGGMLHNGAFQIWDVCPACCGWMKHDEAERKRQRGDDYEPSEPPF